MPTEASVAIVKEPKPEAVRVVQAATPPVATSEILAVSPLPRVAPSASIKMPAVPVAFIEKVATVPVAPQAVVLSSISVTNAPAEPVKSADESHVFGLLTPALSAKQVARPLRKATRRSSEFESDQNG